MTVAFAPDVHVPLFSGTSSYTRRAEVADDPRLRLFALDRRSLSPLALNVSKRKLEEVRTWRDNWDGFDSVRPVHAAIDRTVAMLSDMYDAATSAGHAWQNPHVTASEDGDVVLEWWNANHKLTVYVGADDARYVRVWGPHVERDMDEGELRLVDFGSLWQWLSA